MCTRRCCTGRTEARAGLRGVRHWVSVGGIGAGERGELDGKIKGAARWRGACGWSLEGVCSLRKRRSWRTRWKLQGSQWVQSRTAETDTCLFVANLVIGVRSNCSSPVESIVGRLRC